MKEIDFKLPKLEDKKLIESYFKQYPTRSCERTFANVYLWCRYYQVDYAEIEHTLVFRSLDDHLAFSYPAGDPENVKHAIEFLRGYSEERGEKFCIYSVVQEQFEQLEKWFPGQYQIEYDRDQSDYIYESEKLITLSGKKLHGKRNHINKFKSMNKEWSYEKLSDDNVEECFEMAMEWKNRQISEGEEQKNAEMTVTMNALRMYKELDLTGGVLRAEGKVIAFTLGEEICKDTFVIHIEKAFAEIQGAYPMINQQFVEHECPGYPYINREEDTGEEGLRKAKLSYRPVFFVEKGYVTCKEE